MMRPYPFLATNRVTHLEREIKDFLVFTFKYPLDHRQTHTLKGSQLKLTTNSQKKELTIWW